MAAAVEGSRAPSHRDHPSVLVSTLLRARSARGSPSLRGWFRDAERLADSGLQTLRRMEFTVTPPVLFSALAACRAWRGDHAGAARSPRDLAQCVGWSSRTSRPARRCHRRRSSERRGAARGDAMARCVRAGLGSVPAPRVAAQVEIADVIGDTSLLAAAIPGLEQAVDQGVMWTTGWPLSSPACSAPLRSVSASITPRTNGWTSRPIRRGRAGRCPRQDASTSNERGLQPRRGIASSRWRCS